MKDTKISFKILAHSRFTRDSEISIQKRTNDQPVFERTIALQHRIQMDQKQKEKNQKPPEVKRQLN